MTPKTDSVAVLRDAVELIRAARWALGRLGLRGKGSDLSLSHEVRMFALDFSPEHRDGPGELQVNGTGRADQWLKDANAAIATLSAQGEAVATVEAWSHGETYLHWHTSAMEFPAGAKLYLHPAPPGSDAVTEAVPSDVMQHARHMVEGHYPRHREYQVADWLLRLAARTGKGEA